MNTDEIKNCLEILFKLANINMPVFVLAADNLYELNKVKEYPIAVVQNTDKMKDPGKHWIAWLLLSNKEAEYFDSYGNIIDKYKNIVKPRPIITCENCIAIQSPDSFLCGVYCIYYLYYRALKIKYKNIIDSFSPSTLYNDKKMIKFTTKIPITVKCNHKHTEYCQTNLCKSMCKDFN